MSRVAGVAPGLLLLPARECLWELKRRVEIKIPNEGLISGCLQPETLTERVKIPGDDEFTVFGEDLFSLWEIPRVLFALGLYPQLEANQSLNVTTLKIEGNEITLYGEIIESVEEG